MKTENSQSNNSANQRLAILNHLRKAGSLTTLQARQELAVCHPAARVIELRGKGYDIVTHWRVDEDSTGRAHRVAEYVLMKGEVA